MVEGKHGDCAEKSDRDGGRRWADTGCDDWRKALTARVNYRGVEGLGREPGKEYQSSPEIVSEC